MTISNEEDMIKAAAYISEKYNCSVLCKGGHSINDANDLLYSQRGIQVVLRKKELIIQILTEQDALFLVPLPQIWQKAEI